jgi:hypothetical protein
MKTYTKTVEITEPRLKISVDECPTSPREWDNLGYFITVDRNYRSPDRHTTYEMFVREAGEEAESQAEHIKLLTQKINELGEEKVLAIYPVVKYEYSGVSYSLGTVRGFDYLNNGFYIITDKTAKNVGVKPKDFERQIRAELEEYNKYANGEVYDYILYDKDGEQIDSCGGFYSLDEIKDSLPKEWQKEDMQDYLSI